MEAVNFLLNLHWVQMMVLGIICFLVLLVLMGVCSAVRYPNQELAVLEVLADGKERYGPEIWEKDPSRISKNGVYNTLFSLVERGEISCREELPEEQKKPGPRRRLFKIEPGGRRRLVTRRAVPEYPGAQVPT